MGGLFEISSSEARRLIGQGGVKLDGETLPADRLDYDAYPTSTGGSSQFKKRRFRRLRGGRLGQEGLFERYTPRSLWEGPSGLTRA